MVSYNLRALSVLGEEVVFHMTDIPTKITDNQFVLTQRPNSPILLIDTIVRGDESLGLFEGDIIESGGVVYTITFRRGFAAVSNNKQIIGLKDLGEFKRLGSTRDAPKTLSFKYRSTVFNIGNIVGAFDGTAVVCNIQNRIDPSEIQQDACFTVEGQRVFYGDLYDGYPVIMYYGRPCINKDGEIVELVPIKPTLRGEHQNVCKST